MSSEEEEGGVSSSDMTPEKKKKKDKKKKKHHFKKHSHDGGSNLSEKSLILPEHKPLLREIINSIEDLPIAIEFRDPVPWRSKSLFRRYNYRYRTWNP